MSAQLFNPFSNLLFNSETCFLTGEDLLETDKPITVFPEWIMDRFNYHDRMFTMMDAVTTFAYSDLVLPCSPSVRKEFEKLDKEVQTALENGYDAVAALDPHRLFLWMGKIVYGVLYCELKLEKKRQERRGNEDTILLSPLLTHRFSVFHLMLQSLVNPISFEKEKPWSITLVKVKYSKDILNYRDDAVNLMFSLSLNGFGIVACLQDNGIVKAEQQELIDKIKDTVLHPIQFEEFCARFLYTNYLMQNKPQFTLIKDENGFSIKRIPTKEGEQEPYFDKWDESRFAQVLENYWAPWGLQKKDIYKPPNSPISYLENVRTYELIEPESISLPF